MMEHTTFEAQLDQHGTLVYTNMGTSMMPLLRQGRDLMVIRKKGKERCRKYDAVLFKRDNGQYVLHRVLQVREQDYYIIGDNCVSGEYVDDGHILGILTAVVRNGKTIPVTGKGYCFYVHMWCDCLPLRVGILRIRNVGGKLLRKLGLR